MVSLNQKLKSVFPEYSILIILTWKQNLKRTLQKTL